VRGQRQAAAATMASSAQCAAAAPSVERQQDALQTRRRPARGSTTQAEHAFTGLATHAQQRAAEVPRSQRAAAPATGSGSAQQARRRSNNKEKEKRDVRTCVANTQHTLHVPIYFALLYQTPVF